MADNIDILEGMNEGCVDLIYLDPPFNSNANYARPIGKGKVDKKTGFKDTWSLNDIKLEWLDQIKAKNFNMWAAIQASSRASDKSYLIYMAPRLMQMHRILKDTGSIFLHCDPTMSHYLKVVLDTIFGKTNFQNEIIWCYDTSGRTNKKFCSKHDVILWYSKSENFTYNSIRIPHTEKSIKTNFRRVIDGRKCYVRKYKGKTTVYYLDEGRNAMDWWVDIPALHQNEEEREFYPTQKPLDLLRRIINAASNKDDVVLDPFCGCATTLVAADELHRRWAGIDLGFKAVELVEDRIRESQKPLFAKVIKREDIPRRTDLGEEARLNKDTKSRLYKMQDYKCAHCEADFYIHNLEFDHIKATSLGGTSHFENLQLLCGHCNRVKGDRGMDYLKEQLRIRRSPTPYLR